MLSFIRSDLAQFSAYVPGELPQITPLDRLDANESPFDLPSELKEKLAISYQQEIESNRYPDGGHEQLKQAIADYVNESAHLSNILQSNNISIGNGSDELIRSLLIVTCLGENGSILVADPTFSMYKILAQTLAIPVINVPRLKPNFTIDINAANLALEKNNIKVIFVVHPNSPTSQILNESEINWLRNISENILVVIDEAYFEFSQKTLVGEIIKHPNWVILRTFSKAFRLASHRVGYAIAHPELALALEKIRLPYNLPSLSQLAALTALKNRELLLGVIPQMLAERDKLIEEISKFSGIEIYPSSANFIYLQLREGDERKLKEIYEELKQQGTVLRFINNGLRITIGNTEENQRTLERLKSIFSHQTR
ncbi:MAG TPA: histidinol-phosphate transaminase [Allocoleopsis sp.]